MRHSRLSLWLQGISDNFCPLRMSTQLMRRSRLMCVLASCMQKQITQMQRFTSPHQIPDGPLSSVEKIALIVVSESSPWTCPFEWEQTPCTSELLRKTIQLQRHTRSTA